jgi:erythromycin esterase
MPDAHPGTHEDLIHQAVGSSALLVMPDRATREAQGFSWPSTWRGHRAVGVVYGTPWGS